MNGGQLCADGRIADGSIAITLLFVQPAHERVVFLPTMDLRAARLRKSSSLLPTLALTIVWRGETVSSLTGPTVESRIALASKRRINPTPFAVST